MVMVGVVRMITLSPWLAISPSYLLFLHRLFIRRRSHFIFMREQTISSRLERAGGSCAGILLGLTRVVVTPSANLSIAARLGICISAFTEFTRLSTALSGGRDHLIRVGDLSKNRRVVKFLANSRT